MNPVYDYLIVGSGAGGGVTAYVLAAAGAKVLLLEAGKRFSGNTYPKDEMRAGAQLMWGGGTDMTTDAATVLLRGKVLGGGTVVNQALLDRFDNLAWADFKADSGVSFFDNAAMADHYDAVETHLALHTFHDRSRWNRNAALYVAGFEKAGYQWQPLRRGQGDCGHGNDCMMCLGGCPRDAKQSMAVTFIKEAEAHGLTVRTGFQAAQVVTGADFVTVFGHENGVPQSHYARHCILAAGALGSTELMLKSQWQRRLPALGQHFYCHPQWMSTAFMDEPVDAHKGAFQAVKSADPRFRQNRFKLENVFAGPVAMALLNHRQMGAAHQHYMRRYRHMMCIEVALRDQTPGQISLNRQGRLAVTKSLRQADLDNATKGRGVVAEIFAAVGAKETMASAIRVGLHLMGGARMGQQAATSVVNEGFQVHGMPRVYVADGSLFPNAPGINPSLSIMALAHRAAHSILAQTAGA